MSPALPSSTGSASSSTSARLYRFQSVSYLSAAKDIFVSSTHLSRNSKKRGVSISIHPSPLFLLGRLSLAFARLAQVTVFPLLGGDSLLIFLLTLSLLTLTC